MRMNSVLLVHRNISTADLTMFEFATFVVHPQRTIDFVRFTDLSNRTGPRIFAALIGKFDVHVHFHGHLGVNYRMEIYGH